MEYVTVPKRLFIADNDDMNAIERFEHETMVELELTPEQCPDFLFDRCTGHMMPQVRSLQINGLQWHLRPGKNRIPESVLQFWLDCEKKSALARKPLPTRCIAQF